MKQNIEISIPDAMIIGGYLLQQYQSRQSFKMREISMMGAKAYDESMADLARLVLTMHPRLSVNIEPQHRPMKER